MHGVGAGGWVHRGRATVVGGGSLIHRCGQFICVLFQQGIMVASFPPPLFHRFRISYWKRLNTGSVNGLGMIWNSRYLMQL